MTEQIVETDSLTERALKFKRRIQELHVPYEEVHKDMENKRNRHLSQSFFIFPNVYK